jgi:hypothetical protein
MLENFQTKEQMLLLEQLIATQRSNISMQSTEQVIKERERQVKQD